MAKPRPAPRPDNNQLDRMELVLGRILNLFHALEGKVNSLMKTEAEMLALVKKIDDATTEQGTVLEQEGATLLKISDEMDTLLAAAKGGSISDEALGKLQALADKTSAVSESIKKQAEFSKTIAAKPDNPVPTPPPAPTPPV